MDVQGNARFGTDSIFHAHGVFNNYGTFQKSAGSGETNGMLTFNNFGTVDAASGILNLDGGGLSSGTFTTEAGAALKFSGGSHYFGPTSSVSGDGDVIFESETFNNLNMTIAGSYNITGATTFRRNSGADPVVEFDTDTTMGTFNLNAGTLTGAGNITVTGMFNWTRGTLSGLGTFNANGGITVSGSDGKRLDGRTFNNPGTFTWSGTGNIDGGNDAVFNNLPGAVFDVQTNQTLGGGILFINAGTFRKSAGTGTTTINALFTNTGTLDVESGTVRLGSAFTNFDSATGTLSDGTYLIKGTFQFNNARIVTNQANIILDGSSSGIVNQSGVDALGSFANNLDGASFTLKNGKSVTTSVDFTNLGMLVLGAGSTFHVTGNFTQTSGGTLSVELGGAPASSQFGRLTVTGTATLGGGLTVTLVNGYSGSPGDRFSIVTFARVVGAFGSTSLPPGAALFVNPGDVQVDF
jgi:hypothetical protein